MEPNNPPVLPEEVPKPKRQYRTNWYFADLEKPISEQVWMAGQAFYTMTLNNTDRRRTMIVPLLKYFYFIYETGCRNQEPFLQPYPTMELVALKEGSFMKLSHVNQKHKAPDGSRARIDAAIPIFTQWDRMMWSFITNGSTEFNAERIFAYGEWKSTTEANVSTKFKTNFKADLKDPAGVVHREAGISPHVLRHARLYELLIQHGLHKRQDLLMRWFGWDKADMITYYAEIKRILDIESQVRILKDEGLLRQGMGIDISTYLGQ